MITNRSIAAGGSLSAVGESGNPCGESSLAHGPTAQSGRLHPVLTELVGARLFEPLAQSIRVLVGALGTEAATLFQNLFLDEDLRPGAQGQSDRVARPAVDRQRGVAASQVDARKERVFLEV